MSFCTLDLKTDVHTIWAFVQDHTIVLAFFLALQWVSNHMLNKATRPELNLLQRLALSVVTTIIVFAGNRMMSSQFPSDETSYLHHTSL